jgi:SAM-dependent methyltransferase
MPASVVPPYVGLARQYDAALGVPNFVRTRRAFESLARHYWIRFRSAADVGCGTGLFADYLSRCWKVPVFAVDRSPDMLAIATHNCRGANVYLTCQDLRSLSLPCRVDLVTANFDTLNHLLDESELGAALRRIAAALSAGGHLFFDMVTPAAQPRRGSATNLRFRTPHARVRQQIRWEPAERLLTIAMYTRPRGWSRWTIELHRERAYTPEEIGQGLVDSGFAIRGVHDATTLRPASGCPPRVVVIARKAA